MNEDMNNPADLSNNDEFQKKQLQLQMKMQAMGRKTENVPMKSFGQGNNTNGSITDGLQVIPPMRNSMRNMNHMQMKTLEQLMPKFSNE